MLNLYAPLSEAGIWLVTEENTLQKYRFILLIGNEVVFLVVLISLVDRAWRISVEAFEWHQMLMLFTLSCSNVYLSTGSGDTVTGRYLKLSKINIFRYAFDLHLAIKVARLRNYFPWNGIWNFAGWKTITSKIVWSNIKKITVLEKTHILG